MKWRPGTMVTGCFDQAWAPGCGSGVCESTDSSDSFLQTPPREGVVVWMYAQSPNAGSAAASHSSHFFLPSPSPHSVFLAWWMHPAAVLTAYLQYPCFCNTASYLRAQQLKGSAECCNVQCKSFAFLESQTRAAQCSL